MASRDGGEVPQTDGELTAAEAEEKPPGPAPHWRSLVLLLTAASSLCVIGALALWADSGAAPVGHYVNGWAAPGGHRGERVFPRGLHGEVEGCSGYHEGCLETMCCTEPTEECFQKDAVWAQCLKTCLDTDGDPWICEVLGTQAATKTNGAPLGADSRSLPGATKAKTEGGPSCAEKGESCLDSKCCADPEHQCYMKEEGWAGCRHTCEEGMHDPDGPDDTPWSCADPADADEKDEPDENKTEKEEVERKRKEEEEKHRRVKLQPCNWIGDDCSASRCCNDPGMMCYAKNDYWAECLEVCEVGANDTVGPDQLPWSCAELGMRNAATGKETQGKIGVCAVRGEDCSQAGCCEDAGFRCYMKNASFSGCRAECKADLYDPTGDDWLPWTCVPIASNAKPPRPADFADNLIDVALAAIQEEVEEMKVKEAMARDV